MDEHIYQRVCVCVCVCVSDGEREGASEMKC